jgi:aryl-alcohol dehydrogenase-like predicted oxidoreductase
MAPPKHSQFTLGTAQLGMKYGLVNDQGQPSEAEAIRIVRWAHECGVNAFDTARGYGEAESVLGRALGGDSSVAFITKLGVSGILKNASKTEVQSRVEESVEQSCRALRCKTLDVLLLHGWHQRHAWNGAAWQHLARLQEGGVLQAIGASVYTPAEALAALGDPGITHLQIPINILDWRWKLAGVDRAVAMRGDVVVHARSTLLQGVLAHGPGRWPMVGDFDRLECAKKLRFLAERFRLPTAIALCFAYVRALPWISSIVVGCETMQQLEENLQLFSCNALAPEQCLELERSIPKVPEVFLNPSQWSSLHEPVAVCTD